MPWVRIDEGFPEHLKSVQAGPLASWLHVCALAWCNRSLTDGFVPHGQIRKLADFTGVEVGGDEPDPRKLATRLVEVGLWEEADGGYVVHDFLQYQPSKAKVLQERKEATERMRRIRSADVRANTNRTTNRTEPEVPPNLIDPVPGSGSVPSTEPGSVPRSKPLAHPRRANEYPDEFENFWSEYPRRTNNPKPAAFKAWKRRIKSGADPGRVAIAAGHYAAWCRLSDTEDRFIKQARTWLNEHADEEFAAGVPPPQPNGRRSGSSMVAAAIRLGGGERNDIGRVAAGGGVARGVVPELPR